MDIQYIRQNSYIEKLNKQHNLKNFQSKSEILNDYLKYDALEQQEKKYNITFLVICDEEIIGFFTILTDAIILKDIRNKDIKYEIKEDLNITSRKRNLPAIKIGRFAVDERYTGGGIGKSMFENILDRIKFISENHVGCRYVTVDSFATVVTFYVQKFGFKNLIKDDENIRNSHCLKLSCFLML